MDETKETGLAIVSTDQILQENQEKIMRRDGSKVFPITVPLRKKLEHLKASSMSDLRTRIQVIKQQKHDDFMEAQEHRIQELDAYTQKQNKKMRTRVQQIMQKNRLSQMKLEGLRTKTHLVFQKEAKEFFKIADIALEREPAFIKENFGYDFPMRNMRPKKDQVEEEYDDEEKQILEKAEQIKRAKQDATQYTLVFNPEEYRKKVLEQEFKVRYGMAFDRAVSRINQLELQFDESLLFGDMEVVKNIYYNLRKAEEFIEELAKMELK